MIRCIYAMLASLAVLTVVSCSDDDENADLALLTAEMCDVTTAADGIIVGGTTDSDVRLQFTSPLQCSWAEVADTTYRALLYYNKVEGSNSVKPVMADKVMYLAPHSGVKDKEWTKDVDPVGLTSLWMAENGKYLNMRLTIKTGTADDKQKHSLGLVCDTVMEQGRAKHYYYRLCHSRNNLPEFYSFDVFASIPTADINKDDTLTLMVPTAKGMLDKVFVKH